MSDIKRVEQISTYNQKNDQLVVIAEYIPPGQPVKLDKYTWLDLTTQQRKFGIHAEINGKQLPVAHRGVPLEFDNETACTEKLTELRQRNPQPL